MTPIPHTRRRPWTGSEIATVVLAVLVAASVALVALQPMLQQAFAPRAEAVDLHADPRAMDTARWAYSADYRITCAPGSEVATMAASYPADTGRAMTYHYLLVVPTGCTSVVVRTTRDTAPDVLGGR